MTLKTIALALALALAPVRQANASVSVTVNGSGYTIPQTNEKGWGNNVTAWIQAISAASLYPGSASFPLTSELDLGGTYGIKSVYWKSRTANPASAGQFRLANTDLIEWRNFANGGDLSLGVNTSDQLTFNGNPIVGSAALTASRALVSSAAGLITPATTTSTEIGYVNGVTSAIQTQIDAKSPIASPTFTGTATTPAFILSGGTATTVPYLNASKQLTSSAVTPTELGYVSGVTSAIQTQLGLKAPLAGPTFTGTVTGTFSGPLTGNVTGNASGTAASITGNLTGEVTSVGMTTSISAATVTGKALTGYVSGAGTVAATDTILQAINKLNGNDGLATLKSTLTTKGDIYAATGASTPARMAVGADGTVLTAASGQATGLTWTSPLTNPMTTQGDIIYGGSAGAATRLAAGASTTYLKGGTSPSWSAFNAPTYQKFTSGSGTFNKNYIFTITSGSATVGATYTHNSITYTVYATVASGTQVILSGSAAPLASGTLTKSAGTGDATLTFSDFVSSVYARVRAVGGGGAGSGSSTSGLAATGSGGNTTFGGTLVVANGGAGGSNTSNAPSGGTASLGTGVVGTAASGASGGGEASQATTGMQLAGGMGGVSPFGGAGSGAYASNGIAAANNSGSGGGGAGTAGTSGSNSGTGGAAGGFVDAIIAGSTWTGTATYAYAVGAGGSATNGGTLTGGAGGSGYIEVTEYYQ